MDVFSTSEGWILVLNGFSYESRNQALKNILECIQEFGLDGKLLLHHNGEEKGIYYGGPFDTITLLLLPKRWITWQFIKRIKAFYLDLARNANK
jgi:hypothetical protein